MLVVTSPRLVSEVIDGRACTLTEASATDGIELVVTNDVNTDDRAIPRVQEGTAALSIGAAWIFRRAFIDLFYGPLYNFHGARLPRNRGSGGFTWQILTDSRLGYALVHRLDDGIDTGPLVFVRALVFPNDCRLPVDYFRVHAQQYIAILPAFIKALEARPLQDTAAQPEFMSSYWPRLSTQHRGMIDWAWPVEDIERFIRAFDPVLAGASGA